MTDKKAMKVEGPLHVVCQCDKCKAEKQEPVAWADHGVVNWIADKQFKHASLLYTTPPQRTEPDDIASIIACRDMLDAQPVPPRRTWADLSDEDIEECFTVTPDLYLKRHIAQRISDKLKEKNT